MWSGRGAVWAWRRCRARVASGSAALTRILAIASNRAEGGPSPSLDDVSPLPAALSQGCSGLGLLPKRTLCLRRPPPSRPCVFEAAGCSLCAAAARFLAGAAADAFLLPVGSAWSAALPGFVAAAGLGVGLELRHARDPLAGRDGDADHAGPGDQPDP